MAVADSTASKVCSACKRVFPLEMFGNCKGNKDGKRGWCKACVKAYAAAWHTANRDRMLALMNARHAANREADNAHQRAWGADNRELKSQRAEKYRAKSKEKIAAHGAVYRARVGDILRAKKAAYHVKNKERANARAAAWYAAHPERIDAYREANYGRIKATAVKYHAANREKMNAASKAWRAAHPDAPRVYTQNRRARMRENGGELSPRLSEKLFKLQKGKCACCGKPLNNSYHLDHIVPIALGGKNVDSNIQLLTVMCNRQKHATDPIQFMRERGFLL